MNKVIAVCLGVNAAVCADDANHAIRRILEQANALALVAGNVKNGVVDDCSFLVRAIQNMKTELTEFPTHKLQIQPITFFKAPDNSCLLVSVRIGEFVEIIRFEPGSNNSIIIRNDTNLIPDNFIPVSQKDFCYGVSMTAQSLARTLTNNHLMMSTRVNLENFDSQYVKIWGGQSGGSVF